MEYVMSIGIFNQAIKNNLMYMIAIHLLAVTFLTIMVYGKCVYYKPSDGLHFQTSNLLQICFGA